MSSVKSVVKSVVIGDPHFRVDNIQEVDMFIERITALVIKEAPDFVVCLGDLLHTHERVHTIVLNKAYDFIKRMSEITKTFVLVGNHDYIQNQQFLTQNHWMNGMKEWNNVVIVDSVVEYNVKGCSFIFTPYVPNGRFADALSTCKTWPSVTCIFAHQEFYGCKMGAIISVDGDKWDESNPEIISGHIHSKQRPQKNIYYPGASIQTAFGESEDNIIPVVTFSVSGYSANEVDLDLPKKKIVYTDLESVESMSSVDKNIKLSISGSDYNEFKAFKKTEKYKELVQKGAKVTFKMKSVERVNEDDLERGNGSGNESSEKPVDFKKILYDIVSNDKGLLEMYELVVNKTEVIIL